MDMYDDRPVSVYDNLNMTHTMHTSTPKQQQHQQQYQEQNYQQQQQQLPQQQPHQSSSSSILRNNSINGNKKQSAFANEISFKFDDDNNYDDVGNGVGIGVGNNKKYQQYHSQQQQQQQEISNGNAGVNSNQLSLQHPTKLNNGGLATIGDPQQTFKQLNINTPYYATPIKPTITTTPSSSLASATTTTMRGEGDRERGGGGTAMRISPQLSSSSPVSPLSLLSSSPYNDLQQQQQLQLQQQLENKQIPATTSTTLGITPTGISFNKTPLAPFQQQQKQSQQQDYKISINPTQAITTATATTSALKPITQALPTSPPTSATTVPTTTIETAPNGFSATSRPLSQHSQSDLNESIAAVKAALNDAKSKFFGLDGYSPETSEHFNLNNNNNNSNNTNNKLISNLSSSTNPPTTSSPTPTPATTSNESALFPNSDQRQPQLPTKPQPKYQNIPENSAIFRNQLQAGSPPPELPPKPSHLNPASLNAGSSPSASSTISPNSTVSISPSPERIFNTTTPNTSNSSNNNNNMSVATSSFSVPSHSVHDPIGATSSSKLLPHASYKPLPLNDIDSSHPSQAVYMTTTVPQNIKGLKIAGRHTPTRNSLRHSRMLVVNNKNYQGPEYPNPLNLKRQNYARLFLILQILLGSLLLCLAVWILLLAPNTQIQENPYWTGFILILSGIIGLSIIRFQRIKRRKLREHCFTFLRANSYVISLLAVLLCCIALLCATFHFVRLTASDTKCAPTNVLLEHGSCTCTFRAFKFTNDPNDPDHDSEEPMEMEEQTYDHEYRDLSCQEVQGEWTTILALSMAFNFLGIFAAMMYVCMLFCCRFDSKRYYTTVQTSSF